jgi:hypothetical protein
MKGIDTLERQDGEKHNQTVVCIPLRSSQSWWRLGTDGGIESVELFKQKRDIIITVRITHVIILSFWKVRLDYNRYPDSITIVSTPQVIATLNSRSNQCQTINH